jgi:hypothetical protein
VSGIAVAQPLPAPQKQPPQEQPPPDDSPPDATREIDPTDRSGVPEGAGETPKDPRGVAPSGIADPVIRPVVKKPEPEPIDDKVYPQRVVERPLVLLPRLFEASMAFSVNISPFDVSGLLAGRFGVRKNLEVGLRYSLGAFIEEEDEHIFTGGDVAAPEVTYQLLRQRFGPVMLSGAGQVGLSLLFERFAAGAFIGMPVRVTLFEKVAFGFGRDLFAVKLYRFAPRVDDPRENHALLALDSVNSVLPEGELRLIPDVTYQVNDNWSVMGRLGYIAPDFRFSDAPVVLDAGVIACLGNYFDLELRTGFSDLNHAEDTFFVRIGAALRK